MTKPKTFLTLLFALLLAARVLPLDIYVATNGTGSGTSWADATNSLAGAVAAIEALEEGGGYVYVSNGTYTAVAFTLYMTSGIIGASDNPADVVLTGTGEASLFYFDLAYAGLLSGLTLTGGGGASPAIRGSFVMTNCIVTGNSSGGTLTGIARSCIYSNNTGGQAAAYNTVLYNCLLVGNSGSQAGGAYNSDIYNCTISGNSGTVGGLKECNVYNTISYGNTGDPDDFTYGGNFYSCGAGYTGTGSITNDPLFIGSGDYRLQAGSPCINAGTNSTWTTLTDTDLDGNKRRWPANGRPDMGAYEFGSGTVYRKKVMFMKTE